MKGQYGFSMVFSMVGYRPTIILFLVTILIETQGYTHIEDSVEFEHSKALYKMIIQNIVHNIRLKETGKQFLSTRKKLFSRINFNLLKKRNIPNKLKTLFDWKE